MDPQATRATIVILLLAGGSVGAAWAYDAMTGPPTGGGVITEQDDVVTLVEFGTQTLRLSTGTLPFTGSGTVTFDPLRIPVANLTSVSVTMRVTMQGLSVRDTLSVTVMPPAGESVNGEVQMEANPNGYQISERVIESWSLGATPESVHYPTTHEDQALRWAAENHTDRRATGEWASEVSLNPPITPLRSGNVSLAFTFEYFVAEAYPPRADDAEGQVEAASSAGGRGRAALSGRASDGFLSTPFPEPS